MNQLRAKIERMSQHLLILCLIVASIAMSGCASSNSDRIGFEQARAMFAARGVQPGQPLPALSLVDLEGRPADLAALHTGKPLVLVTASLTCNVARRQQSDVDVIRDGFGDKVAVVVVYTIDAHPKGDPCPYTGKEWVPESNEKDEVLVRQPVTLEQRIALAKQYRDRFSNNAIVLVDTMDDASWIALGQAPNLGLLMNEQGIVTHRQGWFDAKAMTAAIDSEG